MRGLFFSVLMVGILSGQNADSVEVHPCDSPLIKQTKGDGKRPLKLRQMLLYTINVVKCLISERGQKADNIHEARTKNSSYDEAKTLKGYSST